MTEKKSRQKYNATIIGDGAIAQGSGAVTIGSGSVINVSQIGDGNIVIGNKLDDVKTIINQINNQMSNMDIPKDLQTDLQAELMELFELMSTSKQLDEVKITRRLRNFARIRPDVFEVLISVLANPIAGVNATVQKIAASYKQNAAHR